MDADSGLVVAVDGSPSAEAAVRWAAEDAVLRNTRLTIAHAVPSVMGTWLATPVPPNVSGLQREAGRQIVDGACEIAKHATNGAVRISTELLYAATVPALVEVSRNAKLLVVGNRGRGALARTLLGSVSLGVLHHARCPVAVIRHPVTLSAERARGAPVVLGFDGSSSSKLATEIAFEEAARRHVELLVLHAWWGSGAFEFSLDWDDVRADEERALAGQLAEWQQRYPEVLVRPAVVRDQPAQRLIDSSEAAQLIVVGGSGHGNFVATLLGSVSTAVVQAAQIPVIVARS